MNAALVPSDISPVQPVVVLLRHAARPPLPVGDPGSEVAITTDGAADAEAIGRHLGPSLASIRTSPLRRCLETAEAIRRGSTQEVPIIDDRHLGDPGVFIADPDLAWRAWRHRGHDAVLNHLAAGAPPLPGFTDPLEATLTLVDHLLTHARGPGLHIAVTHDALLIPLIVTLRGHPLSPPEWPGFLEAAALWRSGPSLHLHYRSTTTSSATAPGEGSAHPPLDRSRDRLG